MKVVPAITAMLFLLTTTTLLPTDQAARAQEGKAKAAPLTRAEFCTRWIKFVFAATGWERLCRGKGAFRTAPTGLLRAEITAATTSSIQELGA